MVSLKPKEGGGVLPPAPRQQAPWIPVLLVVAVVAIGVVAYGQYSAKVVLEERIAALEQQVQENMQQVEMSTNDLASDIDVVTKRVGVTDQELQASRAFAERLRVEQQAAREALANELATKANATDVATRVDAVLEETTTKVAEVQKEADTKIGTVSGEVKTVATNLELTREDLAASRRELSDVRDTLSKEIARNSTELAALRAKGERDYFEFDIVKGKKNVMQRVADIQVELREADVKKQKYNIIIGVDDNKLEKKDRLANEPVQFLVGRDGLRYELVVNTVSKDRITGYLSAPKDKVLSAERPAFRQQ
jgi:hypothetical protein